MKTKKTATKPAPEYWAVKVHGFHGKHAEDVCGYVYLHDWNDYRAPANSKEGEKWLREEIDNRQMVTAFGQVFRVLPVREEPSIILDNSVILGHPQGWSVRLNRPLFPTLFTSKEEAVAFVRKNCKAPWCTGHRLEVVSAKMSVELG